MVMKILCSFLFCFLCSAPGAQPIIPRFETLGVNEGLSQSSVYSILQDKKGFMWFGTADGLNRYDGVEVRRFKSADNLLTPGNSNFVRGALCEDDKSNVWFANETGIYYYDRVKECIQSAYSFRNMPYNGTLFYLEGIHGNELWMFNANYGMASFDVVTRKLEVHLFPGNLVRPFSNFLHSVYDGNGGIWLALYKNKGISRFDLSTMQYKSYFEDKDISQASPGRKKLFLLSGQSIYIYDSVSRKLDSIECKINGKPFFNCSNVLEDPFGRLWVLTMSNGLLCYDSRQKRFTSYHHQNSRLKSLPIDILTQAFVDRTSNLWIATDGGGVCKLDLKPPRFNLFPLNEGDYPQLKDYFIKCFFEDKKGRAWFGTHSNGFSIFDPEKGAIKTYSHDAYNPSSLQGNIVGAIIQDKEGSMLIGHSMGVSLFDERHGKFTAIPVMPRDKLDPLNIYVFAMEQLSNGSILGATNYGLLLLQKKNGQYRSRSYCFGELSYQTTSVTETNPGEIWYSSPYNGLYHAFAKGDSFVVTEKFFIGVDLRAIHQDETDRSILWVGSAKGVVQFNTATKAYVLYNETNGLANNFVYGVLEDEKHNLWVSTNGGLCYFDRKQKQFSNYSFFDGLQSNEFNTGAFYKSERGTFYFGGIKGFNWFASNAVSPVFKSTPPLIAVSEIEVNTHPFEQDSSFLASKTMDLSFRNNTLSFQFAALDFTRPQANRIQYQLKNWDVGWINTTNRYVRYANLAPGRYELHVRASNGEGIWSKEEVIVINIAAPFWERWWFYAIAALLALASAVAVTKAVGQRKMKLQLKELEKQRAVEAERNRISKDMHDDIGSGLTHIALMSELIQTQSKEKEELKKDVHVISASARKLVRNMGEIIWALNPQNDSLDSLLAYMREQTQEYFEPFNIEVKIDFPHNVPLIKLSNEQRRNLFMVVKEALHNSLKHSEATHVELKAECTDKHICFIVRDNGKGITARIRSGANGLRNMEKRMVEIGGSCSIQTGATGTTTLFSVSRSRLRAL